MDYPHWLIVAGAALLAIGLIGLAFTPPVFSRQRGYAAPPDAVSPIGVRARHIRPADLNL